MEVLIVNDTNIKTFILICKLIFNYLLLKKIINNMLLLKRNLKTTNGKVITVLTSLGREFSILTAENGKDFEKYKSHEDFIEGGTQAVILSETGVTMVDDVDNLSLIVSQEGVENKLVIELEDNQTAEKDKCKGCDCEGSCEAVDELEELENLLSKQSMFEAMIHNLESYNYHITRKASNDKAEKENFLEKVLRSRGV